MSGRRSTGPAVTRRTGPRVSTAQPTAPTVVHVGKDRMLPTARDVDITQLTPDPEQPRKNWDPQRLEELADSIAAHGILQPLLVRENGMDPNGDMRYIIIAGERRYAATLRAIEQTADEQTRARLARVPVVIRDTGEAERRVLQLIENLQREDLPPIEEARALKELMQLQNLTTTGVAERIHRSQGYVDERLRLLRHEDVEAAVEGGVLSPSAAAAVASIRSADARQAWIDRARSGETIRPREVYASKPSRRRVSLPGETALPGTGSAAPLDMQPRAEVAPRPASDDAPTTEGQEHPTLAVPDASHVGHTDAARSWQPSVSPLQGSAIELRGLAPDDGMDALLSAASTDQRLWAEQVLAIGVARDWSCAELLGHLRRHAGAGQQA